MNMILLESDQAQGKTWSIIHPRQLKHLHEHLKVQIGDQLKVGVRGGLRYLVEIINMQAEQVQVRPLSEEMVPAKLPVHLVLALPRPKVLRRLIMDSVTLGVQQLSLIHSYRVEKSYWQTPFLQQLDQYVTLGLEQTGDTRPPHIECYRRFKPFVEDHLSSWITENQPAYVAHPYVANPMPIAIDHPCILLVGPEGGFIPYEIDLLEKNGCQAKSIGKRILRTETAVPNILGRLFGATV